MSSKMRVVWYCVSVSLHGKNVIGDLNARNATKVDEIKVGRKCHNNCHILSSGRFLPFNYGTSLNDEATFNR